MEEIKRFLERINDLLSWKEEISNQKGENFNVFKLCGVNHYENSHSDIMAEFLNPKGSHGCGNDFLLAFCRIVGLDESKYENAEVIREYALDNDCGRVDILIRTNNSKIIIENKIYAGEGENQLQNYRNWLETESCLDSSLYFLTLNGRESAFFKGEYMRISYEKHIIDWLNECIRIAAEKPFVRESLIQYKNLVEDLTKGNTMTPEEEKRIKCIQDNFQAAIAVADSLIQAKAQWFYQHIVEPLLDAGITVDVERGQWQQLIRSSQGKRNCYLDCFFAHRKGATKVIYAYSYDFQDPRREIITYSAPESDEITSSVKETAGMPHAIPDDLWGNPEKAACVVQNILADIQKHFAVSFDQIRDAALVEFFDLWAQDHQQDIDSNNLADGGDLRLKCELNDLVFAFGFSSPKFRNFYYGIRWKDNGHHTLDNQRFPSKDGWEQNDWFPYSKYFEKELRDPGMDDDILFYKEKKATLRWRLDAALEEMKNLIAKIK